MGSTDNNNGDQRRRSLSWEKKNIKKLVPEKEVRIVVAGPGGVGKSGMTFKNMICFWKM